jgi:hypothetical protein
MKITFLGNFQVDYSSETHHKKSLESLGHQVVPLQETQAGSETILDEAMSSDMFIWVHTHGWQTPGSMTMNTVLSYLKRASIPTVTYHLDLWLGLQRQSDLNKDSVYRSISHFFTVDPHMADWFNNNTDVKGHYLPGGVFGEECYMKSPSQEKNDVIFVGSKGYHPEWRYRPELITWLEINYPSRFKRYGGDGLGVVRGDDLNQLYANTKVVMGDSLCIGFNYAGYWSDRVYETTGRGGFIIHPEIEGLEKQFKYGEEIVTYKFNDWEGLKKKIDYYIDHDDERENIRKAGHERTKNNYTYAKRWEHIINEVTK